MENGSRSETPKVVHVKAVCPAHIKPLLTKETFWDPEVNRPYCLRKDGRGYQYRRYLYVRHCQSCGEDFASWSSTRKNCSAECVRTQQTGKPYVRVKVKRGYNSNETKEYWGHWVQTPKRRVIFEQQEIAENVLGRPLKGGECVHHINMDTLDNRHSNLLICDRTYHMWLHQEYGRKFAETLGNTKLIHFKASCQYCGELLKYEAKEIPKSGGYVQIEVEPCKECLTTAIVNQGPLTKIEKVQGG